MNQTYAVVRAGVVVNMIIIDPSTLGGDRGANTGEVSGGGGDSDYGGQLVQTVDGVGIGWHYADGVFTAPAIEKTADEIARENMATANSEYAAASIKITGLNERIADEDWSGTAESVIREDLLAWTAYRKALRAYISAADWSKRLPESPE
ncbi:hypothetical protein I9Y19_000991 [Citrobacter freundii]|uniref:Tail fiber assembly protein n=1 Tax=Citrobacter freundii TaxID=546 RepID=A0ABY7KVJ4_CITFR|nr:MULTISPECIES: hypothetical protein [Citrobacter]EIJ9080447.1 hypothetical protein [Citrobacter freundii]EJH9547578.1 hypothetical protein [Citrobacter freundii]EJO6482059.1 hypothetical protein [Citrobacter freundii]EKW5685409.1 hypothetical protein [Citrobacter freundii]EKX9686658.1 hypothetical protein [Citrobacter freundii]